jgi:hypothetical protein
MVRIFGGAVLIIAGIAGFIEAHSHHPVPAVITREQALWERRLDEIGVPFLSGLARKFAHISGVPDTLALPREQ